MKYLSLFFLYLLLLPVLASTRPENQCLPSPDDPFSTKNTCQPVVDHSLVAQSAFWTHRPVCVQSAYLPFSRQSTVCAYTSTAASSRSGASLGLSLVTLPSAADAAAAALRSGAGETPPGSLRPCAARLQDIPSQGQGLVVTRFLSRGDVVLVDLPVLLVQSHVVHAGKDNGTEFHRLLQTAIGQLPTHSQERIQSLARVTGNSLAEQVLQPNGFYSMLNGLQHIGLYPKAARINHSCRPNTFWRQSHGTLAIEIVALESIQPGQQLTLSYTLRDTMAETRQDLWHRWHFHCQCAICSSPDASAKADDTLRRIRHLESQIGRMARHRPGSDGPRDLVASVLADLAREYDYDTMLSTPRGTHCPVTVSMLVTLAHALERQGDLEWAEMCMQSAIVRLEFYYGPDSEKVWYAKEVARLLGIPVKGREEN